jgi:hypothetical protein
LLFSCSFETAALAAASYNLCNGYTANLGLFSLYFNVGGTFKTVHDTPDPKQHPLTLRLRVHAVFHELLKATHVVLDGLADASGCIDQYSDEKLGEEHHLFAPGNMFVLQVHKIKIAGDAQDLGVFFVPVDNPSAYLQAKRIIENTPTKVVGIAPDTGFARNRIEVRTQFSGGGSFLKSPRVITSPFVLEHV